MALDERLFNAFRRRVPLFQSVPDRVLRRLSAAAHSREYAQGETICRPGDPARHLWILLSGRVGISRCTWKGARVGLELMLPGDAFGLPAVLSGAYPNEIEATRDSVVAALPKPDVMAAIERCPELARDILLAFGKRMQFMESQLVLSREDAERRVIAALLYLCDRFGEKLPVTRAELGEMAGTTTETSIRVVQRLCAKGLLKKTPGALVCDQDGMTAVMCGSPAR